MEAFKECEELKERVKACYGDWFHKLWGGSFDRANCDQETHDYRQCVRVRCPSSGVLGDDSTRLTCDALRLDRTSSVDRTRRRRARNVRKKTSAWIASAMERLMTGWIAPRTCRKM